MCNCEPKKILITSTDLMMHHFLVPHVKNLSKNRFEVSIACSIVGDKLPEVQKELGKGIKIYTVRLVRKPFSRYNLQGYLDLKEIVAKNKFDIIWTNEPVMGVVTRAAAKRSGLKGTKIVYMAHGFHFYKGAPLKNWLLYFSAEWLCSWWTDVLITINKEDYNRAKKRLHARKTVYVPGVGIDLEKFHSGTHTGADKRKELGLEDSDIMLLSVGELNKGKNHEAVMRAIYELENPDVKYFICGTGVLEDRLNSLIRRLHIEGQVKLLGYRTDISELCQAADLFVFPSFREGLPVALMEAIACKTPVVCSRIRGNTDLVADDRFLFDGKDIKSLVEVLKWSVTDRKDMQESMKMVVNKNYRHLKRFEREAVCKKMMRLFSEIAGTER